MEKKPWAFIAHKGGKWAGVISSQAGKKTLAEFMGEFTSDGFSITTVFDQEEYLKTLETMEMWEH